MCGIVAYVTATDSVSTCPWQEQRERLKCATAALAHRGPDDQAIWLSKDRLAGLGHRRLMVCGGADATQPMLNEDASIAVVVNGELYDPGDTLRRRLIAVGHRFRTNGDSELAVHLFEQYGLGFVDYLRGEFAILVFDARCNRLIAVRDRFGIKPLLYAKTPSGQWWFASQSQALQAAGVQIETDHESVWHAMSFQYTLPDRTFARGVHQLPPGHIAILSDQHLEVKKYWDCDYPVERAETRHDSCALAEEFREHLREAVQIRLRGDVPVVAHLSGGVDSASIVQLATETGTLASAFTVAFPGSEGYDERELAQEMASHVSIPLQCVDGSTGNLLDAMPAALRFSEGWAVNGHLPAKFLLNQSIHEARFKVALTGEGADELLAGYPHLRVDLSRYTDGRFATQVMQANPASAGIMLASGTGLDLTSVKHRLGYVPAFLEAKATLGRLLRSHLRGDFLRRFADRDAYAELLEAIAPVDQLRDRHPVHQSLYLWNKTALPQYILRTLGDGCESAHGVEGRLPMLDHRLFEWVKRCPLSCLLRPAVDGSPPTEKWILREALRHSLPPRIVHRPKHPFVAPPLGAAMLSAGPVRDLMESVIDDHPYIDPQRARHTLRSLGDISPAQRVATDPLWWTLLSSASRRTRITNANMQAVL